MTRAIELSKGLDPSLAGVEPLHCEFSQMKSQVCHDPVSQAAGPLLRLQI